MEWIVRIEKTLDVESEIEQRIRIVFNPISENISLFGEAKLKNRLKNTEWFVFSEDSHEMVITLEQLQEKMATVVLEMRKRLIEYENLDKGFSVLKWIGIEEQK